MVVDRNVLELKFEECLEYFKHLFLCERVCVAHILQILLFLLVVLTADNVAARVEKIS